MTISKPDQIEETKSTPVSSTTAASVDLSPEERHLQSLKASYVPRTAAHQKLRKLTNYEPIVEFQVCLDIKAGRRDAKEVQEMRCPICMCDLYDTPIDASR